MILPARSIMYLNGVPITEHSRAPLEVSFEQVGTGKRTVSGTLRRHEIAKKMKLSTSWSMVPSQTIYTVDGFSGGIYLYNLFHDLNSFNVKIWTDQQADKTQTTPTYDFLGRFDDFNYSIEKRNAGGVYYDLWNVSVSIEEF
jgi:hypothetical protein